MFDVKFDLMSNQWIRFRGLDLDHDDVTDECGGRTKDACDEDDDTTNDPKKLKKYNETNRNVRCCVSFGCRNDKVDKSKKCLQCNKIDSLIKDIICMNEENNKLYERITTLEKESKMKNIVYKESVEHKSPRNRKSTDIGTQTLEESKQNAENLLNTIQNSIDKQFVEIKAFVKKSIDESIAKNKQTTSCTTKLSFRMITMNARNEEHNENRDKKIRSKNIIIHNVRSFEGVENDIKFVQKLLKKLNIEKANWFLFNESAKSEIQDLSSLSYNQSCASSMF